MRPLLFFRCNAVRGGAPVNILAEELVPGDIIQLLAGDRVPADARILTCTGLVYYPVLFLF